MKKILCVCIGNSDRSPVMAAVLGMFLKNAGHHDIVVESAGIGPSAEKGCASTFAVTAARSIGLDVSDHCRRRTTSLNLQDYDLIVCASDEIAGQLLEQGVAMQKLYNVQVTNPWPCQFQEDYAPTFHQILVSMYKVVCRYFG